MIVVGLSLPKLKTPIPYDPEANFIAQHMIVALLYIWQTSHHCFFSYWRRSHVLLAFSPYWTGIFLMFNILLGERELCASRVCFSIDNLHGEEEFNFEDVTQKSHRKEKQWNYNEKIFWSERESNTRPLAFMASAITIMLPGSKIKSSYFIFKIWSSI